MTLLLAILKKLLTIYDYWMQIKQLVRLGIIILVLTFLSSSFPPMKKPLIFLFTLLLGRGISFAAPSPQYLEHLTTQILKQQTLTTT